MTALTDNQLAGRRRGVLAAVALLLLVAALVLFGSWRVAHPVTAPQRDMAQQLDQVRAILKQMSLTHVSAVAGDGDRLLVRGVVTNPAQLPQLKQRLGAANLTTELSVRDWSSVANQVRDIFAMHGYPVETHLVDGGLQVSGRFGDDAHAEKVKHDVFGSSDMQGLNAEALGLKLALENFDASTPEAPKIDSNKDIKHVVAAGSDSYIVTADQSRYYVGNALPQGGVFMTVDEAGDVLVRLSNGSIRQLEKSDGYRRLHVLDESGSAAVISPSPSSSAAPNAAASAQRVEASSHGK